LDFKQVETTAQNVTKISLQRVLRVQKINRRTDTMQLAGDNIISFLWRR